MQSMIASQQQLIRRSMNSSNNNINTNTNNNKCLDEKRNNSSDSLNNSTNETMNKEMDSNATNTCETLNVQQLVDSMASTPDCNQPIGTDLNGSGSDVKKTNERAKKKRSNNSWLNILNPTYKTRHEEFKRLFSDSVPNNERLIVDYSCALQKEILVHGRLYSSLNYISFYANIFKWETSLVIKCRDITSLTKANTARVIPNAIQIVTNSGDKYVFTSFGARDKTYVMLFRLWQNSLIEDQPMSSAQLWNWIHYSYGDDLGLTSDDEEEYYSFAPNLVHTLTAQPKVFCPENSDSCNSSNPDLMGDVFEDSVDFMTVSSECKCGSHEGKLIMNETFPVPIDRAFELVFTDNKFIHNLHKSRRTYDLCVTQWEDSAKAKERHLTYTVALNHALVKSARTIELQRLLEQSTCGKFYSIKSEVDNEGVPYCDTFSMHSLWCLTQDSEELTRIKVHAQVVYKKSIWGLGLMKPLIEKSSIQGITDFCTDLTKQLPHWIQIERNLGIVNGINGISGEIKINSQNIDYMSTDSSVSPNNNSIICPNISQVCEPTPDSRHKLYKVFTNIISISDALLIKLILFALLLSVILNIIVLFRIWKIESQMNYSGSVPLDESQMAKNPIYLKQFIENSIQMIKTIESNLIEIQNKFKDEL